MSQNRTVIQGLEPDNGQGGNNMNSGLGNNFYSRSGRQAAKGTVVPGMMGNETRQPDNNSGEQPQQRQRTIQPGKPVVGFLYSVSRTAAGEFWPLQIGRNTIGQSADCDIQLAEGTVSGNHAVIVVRQQEGKGVIASIKDPESTNGTRLNGTQLGFDAEACHNGDIITIGNNYELLLILIDAEKANLRVKPNFIAVATEEDSDEFGDVPPFRNGQTRTEAYDPYGNSGYKPTNGTVGMDGSIDPNHGGTISM